MPESTKYNPTDKRTLRLNITPLRVKGAYFILINIPKIRFKIILFDIICADDLIQLWSLYYTLEIIDYIVSYINDYKGRPQNKS